MQCPKGQRYCRCEKWISCSHGIKQAEKKGGCATDKEKSSPAYWEGIRNEE